MFWFKCSLFEDFIIHMMGKEHKTFYVYRITANVMDKAIVVSIFSM